MKKTVVITIGIVVGLIILFNIFIPNPRFKSKQEELNFAISSKQYKLAEDIALELITKDSTKIEYYVTYLKQHFNRPEKEGKNGPIRDDNTIYIFFENKSKSQDSIVSDIGKYGLGLYYSLLDDYHGALEKYLSVKNEKLKYLNNSKGFIYSHFNKLDSAEIFYKKEIINKGNLDGAYSNLSELYTNSGRYDDLQNLLNDRTAKKYLSIYTEREVSFYFHRYFKYFKSIIFEPIQNATNYLAFISALLILFAWLIYLKKIDIFEPECWKNLLIIFLFSAVFTFFVYPITDIINIYGKFRLNGNIINDFFYCIFTIGFVEELVKIIPFLLVLKYTNIINEPLDYIIYASVSALGFAFIENIKYFDYQGLDIIHGRALISVIGHMFNTSLIAYGIVYNEFVSKKNKYFYFIIFLLLASFVHGFFDFWLINETVNALAFISILTVIVQISLFNSFINNTLNQSNFYTEDKSINSEILQVYLFISLSSIFVFEYVAITLKYSVSAGNSALFHSIYSGTYILVFITTNLSRFKVVKGSWDNMHYWGVSEQIDYAENIVNKQIDITKFTINNLTELYLSNQGLVISNHKINKLPNWYYIKLLRQINNTDYSSEFIMIRPKKLNEKLKNHSKMIVALYLIKNKELQANEIKIDNIKFIGWARIN